MPDAQTLETVESQVEAGLRAARSARDLGFLAQADEIVSNLISRFPDQPAPYHWKASILINDRRLGEAAQVLELAAKRFQSNTAIAVERAWLSYHEGNYQEAIERWHAIIASTPNERTAYRGLAMSLRNAGRLDEAEDVLLHAMHAFKDDPWIAADHAALASHRRDLELALNRWISVRDTFPAHAPAYSGVGIALMNAERFEEAEAAYRETLILFPDELEPRIHTAVLAERRRDWPEAARRWGDVRVRAPGKPDGYARAIQAYIKAGQMAEAEALADEALEKWPNNPDMVANPAQLARHLAKASAAKEMQALPIKAENTKERFLQETAKPSIERASAAELDRDWPRAAELWDYVRKHFPSIAAGYIGAARALREMRRFDEAEAVLVEAVERLPDDPGAASERCWLSQIARDFPEADRRWTTLRSNFPNISAGWTVGAVALRELRAFDEAEALLRDAMLRFPSEAPPVVEYAWLATARRDWPEAIRRWETVRARFADRSDGLLRGALALNEVWRHDDAEALLRAGMDRFPEESSFAVEYAETAFRQAHIDDAIARYAIVRERFPNLVAGYLGGARALRNQFKLLEAEGMYEHAQALLPNEPQFAFDHAMIPVFAPLLRDRDPVQAISRLEKVIARFPDFPPAYIELARQLRGGRRFDEAEDIARAGMERVPTSSALHVEYANIARERGNLVESAERFTLARDRFPGEPGGLIGLGASLAASGREAEAETVLQEAMKRFPNTQASFVAYAEIAMNRGDWKEAIRRLSEAQRVFPDDKAFPQRIADAKLHLIGDDGSDSSEEETAKAESDDPRAQFREMIMQFESLGGRGLGCEFGMFQREFTAEPLGLLRWADMPYDGIIYALENRFEGVGLPENTLVFVNRENARPEYCSRDLRGFMYMRAFVYEDEMPIERMEKQALRRLIFLRKKLIADLESGDKIFVWRLTERNLTNGELDRLHAAVRSYGNNVLFYVRYEDDLHPNGTVEIVKPGLMIGYMDRFKMAPDGVLAATPPSGSWSVICQKAHSLWQEALSYPSN
jgi:tetratricopeptide (TPR) repeat protein